MLAAVVPVLNEEQRIGRLLKQLLLMEQIQKIYVILNGSNKPTQQEVITIYQQNKRVITVATFTEPLGIDVPRAVGANFAFRGGANYTLFVDGDLIGDLRKELGRFIMHAKSSRLDLALMDCYPQLTYPHQGNADMFYFRKLLNSTLGIYHKVGIASPSHGPHMVSRRLLTKIPWQDFCVPPTLLTYACENQLNIDIAGTIPHICLGSQIKNGTHNELIVDTIAGDCLEAVCLAKRTTRSRQHQGRSYLGYHPKRRFDLLYRYLGGRLMC